MTHILVNYKRRITSKQWKILTNKICQKNKLIIIFFSFLIINCKDQIA